MNEQALTKFSIITCFFGLFTLFIISIFLQPPEVKISSVQSTEHKDVKITGKVIAIKDFGNMAILEVAEIKSVNVVVFDKRMINFNEDANVTIAGEVKSYKEKKEVIAEKIKLVG